MKKWMLFGAFLLSVSAAVAQDTCPNIIKEALDFADEQCASTERNQACYGNVDLEAIPQKDAVEFKFDSRGDIANLVDINRLTLQPMDISTGKWGLVVMKVQADIPDSIPGQSVTFILFGDVTIENASQDGQTPMQAFYLTTGIGDSNCAEAPESGLMVQTPSGVKTVSFNINGIDVEMGSTVVFQAERGREMRVKTIEGKARLKIEDEIIAVTQGSELVVPISQDLAVTDAGSVIPYEAEAVESLPIEMLSREIEIAEPLSEEQIGEVEALSEAGAPLCSDESDSYLPSCGRPIYDVNGEPLQYDEDGSPILFDENGEPLLYSEDGRPITSQRDYDRFEEDWNAQTPPTDFDLDLTATANAITATFEARLTATLTRTPIASLTPTRMPVITAATVTAVPTRYITPTTSRTPVMIATTMTATPTRYITPTASRTYPPPTWTPTHYVTATPYPTNTSVPPTAVPPTWTPIPPTSVPPTWTPVPPTPIPPTPIPPTSTPAPTNPPPTNPPPTATT